MEPKVVKREVKTITTLKYDDGSTKTTEDFKAYSNVIDTYQCSYMVKSNIRIRMVKSMKINHPTSEKLFASVMMNPVKKNPILNQYLKPKPKLALNLTPNLNLKIPNAKPPRETTS